MNDEARAGLNPGILLAAFAALVLLRVPNVFLEGRFFGEEGTYFFAYAWHNPGIDALLHPLGGYLNIIASGGTLLAKVLVTSGAIPLEAAPWVTASIAFLFQMLPAVMIVSARDAWLAPRLAKPAALLLIAAAPMAHEVWLHTLHSQFHLTICVAIIVALDIPQSRALRVLRLSILAFAPLCGPAAIVLLPFLGLKALIEQRRDRWIELLALAMGTAIQLLGFYYSVNVRGHSVDPAMLAPLLLVRQVVLPLAGPFAAKDAGFAIYASGGGKLLLFGLFAICAALFGALILIALRRWREAPVWLILPALVIACISYFGAIASPRAMLLPLVGERYSFVPNVLIGLSLIALASTASPRLSRVFVALVAVEVLVAVIFVSGPKAEMTDGPAWPDEVALWRKDPNYRLKVWPGDWNVNLTPGSPPCPRQPGPADPEYCDGHWEEREKQSLAGMPH